MSKFFCVLHLIVIFLLNFVVSEDVQIVTLPVWNTEFSDLTEVPLNISVFGQNINLLLKRNNKLLSPSFQVWRHLGDNIERAFELNAPAECYYLHSDSFSSAAINACHSRSMRGMIFLDNATLEISPLKYARKTRINKRSGLSFEEPHIIKKSYLSSKTISSLVLEKDFHKPIEITPDKRSLPKKSKMTIELALFFDEMAYKTFAPFFDYNEIKLRDMLLAYVNGIQALYHHPSLGSKVDIVLVRLDLMKKQPLALPHFGGERSKLLNSFCSFTQILNAKSDDDPNHWDMSLYVSGLDFYTFENGQKNSVTMGLATVSGACLEQYNCVIVEFGVTNRFGKPYPSAGFTSVYIAAHEIGHNLGMHHDSAGNICPRDGFIMSPSRGTHGETTWSECSRNVINSLPSKMTCLLDTPLQKLDVSLEHEKYLNMPGKKWDAKKQCQLLLRDQAASPISLENACEALKCRSPHRSGFYYAGPALDGTTCGLGMECHGGVCTRMYSDFSNSIETATAVWSDWVEGPCRSGCIQNSFGASEKRRTCIRSESFKANLDCEGYAYEVYLCNDDKLCKKERRSVTEFASIMCSLFSKKIPLLDQGTGLQAPHESSKPWMACAIFCRRKDIASYYTPRVELNDLGIDPYFPDGTWCHREGDLDYYCRQHHCLPENLLLAKDLTNVQENDDEQIGFQNAPPTGDNMISDQLIQYLSLGVDGRPLSTTLQSDVATFSSEDNWADHDYIELTEAPNLKKNISIS